MNEDNLQKSLLFSSQDQNYSNNFRELCERALNQLKNRKNNNKRIKTEQSILSSSIKINPSPYKASKSHLKLLPLIQAQNSCRANKRRYFRSNWVTRNKNINLQVKRADMLNNKKQSLNRSKIISLQRLQNLKSQIKLSITRKYQSSLESPQKLFSPKKNAYLLAGKNKMSSLPNSRRFSTKSNQKQYRQESTRKKSEDYTLDPW